MLADMIMVMMMTMNVYIYIDLYHTGIVILFFVLILETT